MTNCRSSSRGLGELKAPARNNYFYGKLMDVWHFQMEQAYQNRHRWLLNRLSLGTGVLCGLQVAATNDNLQVRVGPGVAVDSFGREIIVPSESPPVNPRQPTDDCGDPDGDPIQGAGTVTLCLSYLECAADPAPALVGDCDTREGCQPSTIRERYRLQIRNGTHERTDLISDEQCAAIFPDEPAEDHDARLAMCNTLSGACPEPDDDCVVLATIELAEDGTIAGIDPCTSRSVVYSNAMLLDLILCLSERVDACCVAEMLLRYVSGDNQSAEVNTPVGQPLVVEVLQGGEVVPDEPVTFSVTSGGGVIGDDASNLQATFETTSGPDGRATLPIWQLGPNAGENEVQATIADGAPAEVIFRSTGIAVEVDLPVVRAIWPPNAAHLSDNEQLEWLERWRAAPTLEITFNHEMLPEHLQTPDPWLRLWRIRSLGNNEIEVVRLEIGHADRTDEPILGEDGFTEVYKIGIDPNETVRSRFLVQMRAENGTIQDTSTPPLLLDAEFRGSKLRNEHLDRIWDIADREFVEQEVWDTLVDTGETLPQSGDGTEGGRFNSWFRVMLQED